MVCLALSVNLRAAEYCRAQRRGLLPVAEAFGVLTSTDALRNPISVVRSEETYGKLTRLSSFPTSTYILL
jgi:hypothetical protein